MPPKQKYGEAMYLFLFLYGHVKIQIPRCCVVIYNVLISTPVHSGSETVHVLQQQLPLKIEENHVKTLVRIANLRITTVTVHI
jgi:hypothetical protein